MNILFRGKPFNSEEYVYGTLISNKAGSFIAVDTEGLMGYREGTTRYATGFYEVDPDTVGQFIGLQDKNGKDIYANDLVHFVNHYRDKRGIGKVTFKNASFCIDTGKSLACQWSDYIVTILEESSKNERNIHIEIEEGE